MRAFRSQPDLQIFEERSCLFINVRVQSHSCASIDRAALREDSSQVDIVGVNLERLLALTVVNAVHRH